VRLVVRESPIETHVSEKEVLLIGRSLEGQPEQVPDAAVSPVAARNEADSEALAPLAGVLQLDRHPGDVLSQGVQLDTSLDRHTELAQTGRQQPLGLVLLEGEREGIRAVETLEGKAGDRAAVGVDVEGAEPLTGVDSICGDAQVLEDLERSGLHRQPTGLRRPVSRLIDYAAGDAAAR